MTQEMYYSRLLPVIALLYIAILFLLDWDSKAIIVGAILIGALALAGSFVNRQDT
jgi:hypothetical protein